jgi:hypothetical protein
MLCVLEKTTCKHLRKMTGSNVWVAAIGCTSSIPHTKTNASTAVESYCDRKPARCRRGCRIFCLLQLRLLSSLGCHILYLWCLFYFNVDISSLFWITFNSFNFYLASWIHRIFSKSSISPYKAATIPEKSGVSAGMTGRDATETTFFRRSVSQRLSRLQIFCTQLSKVETLNMSLNFRPFWRFSDWVTTKVAKILKSLQKLP